MPRTTVHRVDVGFGDCEPAGIVFHPDFSRCEGADLAAFANQVGAVAAHAVVRRDPDNADRLGAMPVPDDIRLLCS